MRVTTSNTASTWARTSGAIVADQPREDQTTRPEGVDAVRTRLDGVSGELAAGDVSRATAFG